MSMGERLLELRKTLKLNQNDFAEKIKLKRSAILAYEKGYRNITERSIADICRTFNVSETWLREGKGPMFRPVQNIDNELSAAVAELIANKDEWSKEFILNFLKLPPENRDVIKKFISTLANDTSQQKK